MRCVGAGAVPLFFFNDTATTEIYTLSLHDALPISVRLREVPVRRAGVYAPGGRNPYPSSVVMGVVTARAAGVDRKSTRLNSSHANISYAVFCLKKQKRLKP